MEIPEDILQPYLETLVQNIEQARHKKCNGIITRFRIACNQPVTDDDKKELKFVLLQKINHALQGSVLPEPLRNVDMAATYPVPDKDDHTIIIINVYIDVSGRWFNTADEIVYRLTEDLKGTVIPTCNLNLKSVVEPH